MRTITEYCDVCGVKVLDQGRNYIMLQGFSLGLAKWDSGGYAGRLDLCKTCCIRIGNFLKDRQLEASTARVSTKRASRFGSTTSSPALG
jgi:hypothetical protein